MKSNLKQLRNDAGLSLSEIGDMCGRSIAQIHRLESDKANPTLATAYGIATALDVAVEDIWPNTVEMVDETITVRRIRTEA